MLSTTFGKEAVLNAYKVLKTAKSTEEVRPADNLLKSFQKSREAWPVSQELLLTPNLEAHVYIQSARTLKHKVEYDFAQLSTDDYHDLVKLICSNTILFWIHSHLTPYPRAHRSLRSQQTQHHLTAHPCPHLRLHETVRDLGQSNRVPSEGVHQQRR